MERSLIFLCLFYLLGCQTEHPPASSRPPARDTVKVSASVPANPAPTPASILPPIDYDTSAWTELIRLDSSIVLDLRYATDNNFVGEQLYDCGRCFLRPAVAKALVQVHQALKKEGLALKMFDCYRPRPIQWALWKKVPDPRYVANPRKGSMHNRGTAVDLTLVKLNEEELPMGTPYDYFGKEAHTAISSYQMTYWPIGKVARQYEKGRICPYTHRMVALFEACLEWRIVGHVMEMLLKLFILPKD
jgi:D-alanyl-D-alanine dipeptidase